MEALLPSPAPIGIVERRVYKQPEKMVIPEIREGTKMMRQSCNGLSGDPLMHREIYLQGGVEWQQLALDQDL
jgi:hypothetical protein